MLMLVRDTFLDLIEFGSNPRIIFVSMSVQLRKNPEALCFTAMIDQPTGRLDIHCQYPNCLKDFTSSRPKLSLVLGTCFTSGNNKIRRPRKTAGMI